MTRQYQRKDSKYGSRGHINDELALHRAELRKNQPPTPRRKQVPPTPEQIELRECSAQLRRCLLTNQPQPAELRARYTELFQQVYAANGA